MRSSSDHLSLVANSLGFVLDVLISVEVEGTLWSNVGTSKIGGDTQMECFSL